MINLIKINERIYMYASLAICSFGSNVFVFSKSAQKNYRDRMITLGVNVGTEFIFVLGV